MVTLEVSGHSGKIFWLKSSNPVKVTLAILY